MLQWCTSLFQLTEDCSQTQTSNAREELSVVHRASLADRHAAVQVHRLCSGHDTDTLHVPAASGQQWGRSSQFCCRRSDTTDWLSQYCQQDATQVLGGEGGARSRGLTTPHPHKLPHWCVSSIETTSSCCPASVHCSYITPYSRLTLHVLHVSTHWNNGNRFDYFFYLSERAMYAIVMIMSAHYFST